MDSNNDNMMDLDALSPLDYDKMRAMGLEYIQKIARQNWTDFNLHDPGVTIWEALCFSLSDLAYRTGFEIKDLLTEPGNSSPTLEEGDGTLFLPHNILTSNPLTILDYRKLILENVPEVQNVWLEPYKKGEKEGREMSMIGHDSVFVKGFYQVRIQCEDNDDVRNRVKVQVSNLLNEHRNLCERFLSCEDWIFLKPVDVCFDLGIEVEKYSDLPRVIHDIYQRMDSYVSPKIPRYTLSELLEKGKTYDEIFQGYYTGEEQGFLGFIDVDELFQFNNKKKLYVSDIINIIMKVDGVCGVSNFQFVFKEDDDQNILKKEVDCISIDGDESYFRLSPLLWEKPDVKFRNEISVCRGAFSIPLKLEKKLLGDDEEDESVPENKTFFDVPSMESGYRNVRQYYSFQNILPKCYKLRRKYLAKSDTPQVKGRSKQLKGYLSLFDQFISDYLVRLGSIRDLFSVKETENDPDVSWFHGLLSDDELDDISGLLKYGEDKNRYAATKFYELLAGDRRIVRERILDHLLSRFNETFPEYYEGVSYEYYELLAPEFDKMLCEALSSSSNTTDSICEKKNLLRSYPSLSKNRSRSTFAFPFLNENGEEIHEEYRRRELSGVERRILTKLGINIPDVKDGKALRQEGNDSDEFSLHILEHILFLCDKSKNTFLKMRKDANGTEEVDDPYSFHVTVVLPGWLEYTGDRNYRMFAENVIREELPAHVVSKICWVSADVMHELEDVLDSLYNSDKKYASAENIQSLMGVFNKLVNVYPPGSQYLNYFYLPETGDAVLLPDLSGGLVETEVVAHGESPSSSEDDSPLASAEQVAAIVQSLLKRFESKEK